MKAIVFDIDGTLIESMAIDSALYSAAIRDVLGPVEFRAKLSDYDNVTDSGIIAQLIEDNGLSIASDVVDSIRTLFVESLAGHIRTSGPFPEIPGAIQIVDRLRSSKEHRVAIATGGWRSSALLKLESSGFNVDGIPLVSCDESPYRTEIMRSALAKLGGSSESVTYFGDAEWDERACRALGWDFIAVGHEIGGIESFEGIDP